MLDMKNTRIDFQMRQEMGTCLREAIVDNINEGVEYWIKMKVDLEMWDLIKSDTDDLLAIAGFIDADMAYHRLNQAFEKACDLDTAARDVIPLKVWNWLSVVNAENKEHWACLDDGAKYNV